MNLTLETYRDGRVDALFWSGGGLEIWVEWKRDGGTDWGVERRPGGTTVFVWRLAVTFSRAVRRRPERTTV